MGFNTSCWYKFNYDYSKADFEGLDACIFNSNLVEYLTSQDVEYVWSKIFSTISDAMDMYIPKFCLHSHQFPKWFSAELRHQFKCLQPLQRKYEWSSNHNFEHLCKAEEKFQQNVKDSKSKYETYLINSYASRQYFKLFQNINSIAKSKARPSSVYYNTTTANNDKE